ncbi:transposon Ty3-G Gag-Pol polyprotein [Pycnococcus provasolii]
MIDALVPYGDTTAEDEVEDHDGWSVATRLTAEQKQELAAVLNAHRGAFAWSNEDIPGYHGVDGPFKIEIADQLTETRQGKRRLNQAEQGKVDEWYQAFFDAGYIRKYQVGEPLYGKHAMNTTVAAKKDAKTGAWTDCRVCADSRAVNSITVRDRRAMHRVDDQIARLASSRYITAVDLRKGFNQIPMAEESVPFTQFWWKGEIYVWTRMTFGYVNAAAKFQTVMDRELGAAGLDGDATCYIDDLCLHHDEWEGHLAALERMLVMCESTGLRLHPDKCKFGMKTVNFLGHKVGGGGMTPDEAKVAAIRGMGTPESASDLRSQLGLISYYRTFIPNASAIVEGLRPLLKKGAVWGKDTWTAAHRAQLDELKEKLTTPGIGLFHFDESLETHVYTDFSSYGIAAVLAQVGPDGKERLCACISRSLNVHEAKYPSYYGELLAVTWALRSFHPYVWGRPIKLITDHQPLVWLMDSTQRKNAHHTRWALMVDQYELVVVHRAGAAHANADVPSRFPLATDEDNTGARLDSGEERNLGIVAIRQIGYVLRMPNSQLCDLSLQLLQSQRSRHNHSNWFSGRVPLDFLHCGYFGIRVSCRHMSRQLLLCQHRGLMTYSR